MSERRRQAGLLLLALYFVGCGLLFVPRLGIEVDEAMVANGIYPHGAPWYSWHFGEIEVPVMLISYLGALKTWMYSILFWFTPPRPISLRLPTLLLGAGTLWLFFSFLDLTISRRAAWIGTVLLATDASYILMNAIDYGPVTVQFLLKLAALVLLVKFHRTNQRAFLAWAFFLFGLAMWDKAIFAWVLFGFVAGVLTVFPRQLAEHVTWKNLRIAALAMIAGAFPLIVYNIARPLETLRANVQAEQLAVWGKSVILTRTMDGSVLFGFMTAPDSGPHPGEAGHWYQSVSFAVSDLLGSPRNTLTLWAACAAVLSLVALWRTPARKPIMFAFVVCVATWLPMVLTAGAGAAAQHVILLWPFHLMMIAAALDRIPFRAAAIAATVLLCTSSVAVTNQYYTEILRNGPALRWTDAMDPLHRFLADTHAPRIYVADWGIIETMNLLSEGALPLYPADLGSEAGIRAMLVDSRNVFVAHAKDAAIHPSERAAVEDFAAREEYIEEAVATITDRNGRPSFDVFRFRKLHL